MKHSFRKSSTELGTTLYDNKVYCTMKSLRDHFGYMEDAWYPSLAEVTCSPDVPHS
jgi:hypothetical protein